MSIVGRWFIISVLLAAVVLVGCTAPKSPAATPTPTPGTSTPTGPSSSPAQLSREAQLIEAAKKEGEVNFWVHTIDQKEALVKLFQARYPFLTLKIWDSRGSEILAKMAEESKAGKRTVDVLILSSEMVEARELGLLADYEFPNMKTWPYQPAHNQYKSITGTGRVVIYNTNLVSAADVPKTWDDVKSTKWAGRSFASTSGEDNPLFWAAMWGDGKTLNWDRSFAFWGDVIKNHKPRVVSGFSGSLERLAAGEAAIMPGVPTLSSFRFISRGAPIAIAPLGNVSGDMNMIALVKNAPHPNAARLLIDWLTTEEGLLAYANPTKAVVLEPSMQPKGQANGMFKSLGLEWSPLPEGFMTAENIKKSADFWLKALGVRG